MGLPYAAHCHLLPLLSNSLPIFNEICRRSAKLILSCLCSQHSYVRLLTLTRLLVVMLCFYIVVIISNKLISSLARLPI